MRLLAALAITIMLAGCGMQPVTPSHVIAAASATIEDLAVQIDVAQRSGHISNEREDQLLDRLAQLNQQLRIAHSLTGDQQMLDLEAINQALTELQIELARESEQ